MDEKEFLNKIQKEIAQLEKKESFWRKIKKHWGKIKKQWKMFRELQEVTAPDCLLVLFFEFIFNPSDLETRYHKEVEFKRNMNSRWRQ